MCLFRSALISLFCKYWPACFTLIPPFRAPLYHYLLWSVSPAVLINIILAYFENVGMCVICCKPAMYLCFFPQNTEFKVLYPLKCLSLAEQGVGELLSPLPTLWPRSLWPSESLHISLNNIFPKICVWEGRSGGNVWWQGCFCELALKKLCWCLDFYV